MVTWMTMSYENLTAATIAMFGFAWLGHNLVIAVIEVRGWLAQIHQRHAAANAGGVEEYLAHWRVADTELPVTDGRPGDPDRDRDVVLGHAEFLTPATELVDQVRRLVTRHRAASPRSVD